MGLLSAGAGVRGEFENRLKGLIKEVRESTENILLFVDEAHTMIGAGGEAGQNDAANLLKPEMARGELKIIGATTFAEFRKYIEKDPAMARRFQMINILEPDVPTAILMLRGLKSKYEKFHGITIPDEAISAACQYSHKYIAGRQLPDKAVDLLDTASARLKMSGLGSEKKSPHNTMPTLYLSATHVADIISEWTGIPVGHLIKDEAAKLLSLEAALNNRVKGQTWGISELSQSLLNAKVGLKNENAPMGVFVLTGPSGVGKTETAEAIADVMFGGPAAVVTINMSEYQDSMSVTQLKGASAGYVGYGEGGVLTESVRKRPYSVVILDEVEKAHRNVLNMFFQVFDKGILKDGEGRDISFKNTVIVMTSNLGLETITDMAMSETNYTYNEYKKAIFPEVTHHFSPALLGRCKMIPYLPLGNDTLEQIVKVKIDKVGEQLRGNHQIVLAASPIVIEKITGLCVTRQSGARNIDTILDDYILPLISKNILAHVIEGNNPSHLYLNYSEDSGFSCTLSDDDFDTGIMADSTLAKANAGF